MRWRRNDDQVCSTRTESVQSNWVSGYMISVIGTYIIFEAIFCVRRISSPDCQMVNLSAGTPKKGPYHHQTSKSYPQIYAKSLPHQLISLPDMLSCTPASKDDGQYLHFSA